MQLSVFSFFSSSFLVCFGVGWNSNCPSMHRDAISLEQFEGEASGLGEEEQKGSKCFCGLTGYQCFVLFASWLGKSQPSHKQSIIAPPAFGCSNTASPTLIPVVGMQAGALTSLMVSATVFVLILSTSSSSSPSSFLLLPPWKPIFCSRAPFQFCFAGVHSQPARHRPQCRGAAPPSLLGNSCSPDRVTLIHPNSWTRALERQSLFGRLLSLHFCFWAGQPEASYLASSQTRACTNPPPYHTLSQSSHHKRLSLASSWSPLSPL